MKYLMAANWKMYKNRQEAQKTASELFAKIGTMPEDRELVIFAPFTAIETTAESFKKNGQPVKGFSVGGQDLYPASEGAYTGEISPGMLIDAGATWVLTGHSERRAIIGENNAFVGQKTAFAMNAGLKTCLCIGETLAEREAGKLNSILEQQIKEGVKDLSEDFNPDDFAVAYEPVWAIGTGKVAGVEEITEAHNLVRSVLIKLFKEKGKQIRILYGGSVKPDNATQIIKLDNVDGVLVGGASLQSESFAKIVLA
ncbi:triose-phosphate isomerase [Desulfovibrio litoralis]|uniref:Triosephosphate isomerase n=1 Tax=Desulfovibrio litoralis DSM 11393 TaxID=1121455 RepID=A0A1M7S0X0_9BACT|nr:triose-phosphate isomerase [Desulfovibrio litoralis]SHN52131.1 triosephosphate isomerase [Desulfovibrio litoralis DSM 11393]